MAVVLTCMLCLAFVPTAAFAEKLSDSLILRLQAGEIVDNRVEITASLEKNSGVTGMTLSLHYDKTALKLVEAVDGEALANMSKVHSGKNLKPTEDYKINYTWRYYENDYSKGVLLTFVFEINEGAADGTYEFSLTAPKKGVEYLEESTFLYKNLVSDTATITLKGNQTVVEVVPGVDDVVDEPTTPQNTKILQILIPVTVGAILLVVLTVILVLKKGKNSKK